MNGSIIQDHYLIAEGSSPCGFKERPLHGVDSDALDALGRKDDFVEHIDLIAARMEQARWERGISVAELARRIGVDRKRLWRVLNGERAMRADEFVRLCAELGVGLGRFLPGPSRESFRPGHQAFRIHN